MRCKKGDLAIIVRSAGENLGKIVEVVKFLGNAPITYGGRPVGEKSGPIWLVKTTGSPLLISLGYHVHEYPIGDSRLRPIRGDEDKHDAPTKEKELQS